MDKVSIVCLHLFLDLLDVIEFLLVFLDWLGEHTSPRDVRCAEEILLQCSGLPHTVLHKLVLPLCEHLDVRVFVLLLIDNEHLVSLALPNLSLQVPLLNPLLARIKLHTLHNRLIETEVSISECRWLLLYVAPSLVEGHIALVEPDLIVFLSFTEHF